MIALVEYLVQARSSFERIALVYQLLGALVVTGIRVHDTRNHFEFRIFNNRADYGVAFQMCRTVF
ncbi:hypothetical protein SP68_05950 [Klebsiella variicola]|nr:hypothetical protein SP68_05950 [Klebsiella variicola]GKL59698.1 hypothetical protein NUKP61_37470 [Klebsiella variicola]